ncbi:MAG: hypothetical protein WC310_04915 [Patescibacteria group bacterium]|jgi:hypothetical protein
MKRELPLQQAMEMVSLGHVYLKVSDKNVDTLVREAIDRGILLESSKWIIGQGLRHSDNVPEGEYYLAEYKGAVYRITDLNVIPNFEQQATAPTIQEILSFMLYGRNTDMEIPEMIKNNNIYKMLSRGQ